MKSLVNRKGNGFHYCVDIDIKGFFDNVHHGKLLKQLWTIGIRDKKLLSIISRLLKAEIVNEGVPQKVLRKEEY
jgi:RNA-directed DNA polymerase